MNAQNLNSEIVPIGLLQAQKLFPLDFFMQFDPFSLSRQAPPAQKTCKAWNDITWQVFKKIFVCY